MKTNDISIQLTEVREKTKISSKNIEENFKSGNKNRFEGRKSLYKISKIRKSLVTVISQNKKKLSILEMEREHTTDRLKIKPAAAGWLR